MTIKDWKKEFREKYESFELCERVCKADLDRLESYIDQLLEKQREASVMEILSAIPDYNVINTTQDALLIANKVYEMAEKIELKQDSPTIAEDKCMWCGKTYEEHRDEPFPNGGVAKTPCGILKSGFMVKPNSPEGKGK